MHTATPALAAIAPELTIRLTTAADLALVTPEQVDDLRQWFAAGGAVTAADLAAGATRELDARDWHDLARIASRLGWDGTCLYWTGYRRRGYGRMHWRGKNGVPVHRALHLILHGRVPLVGHACGRGKHGCATSGHLVPQTVQENARQMVEDGNSRPLRVGGRCRADRHDITCERDIMVNGPWRTCRQCSRERKTAARRRQRQASPVRAGVRAK